MTMPNKETFRQLFVTALIPLSAILLLLGLYGCQTENKPSTLTDRLNDPSHREHMVVQLAELEVDPEQLEDYVKQLKIGIETSVAKEPGVLTLYALQDEKDPGRITVVEVYADQDAYESHIASAHFQTYKTGTLEMVRSLQLHRMKPIVFGAK